MPFLPWELTLALYLWLWSKVGHSIQQHEVGFQFPGQRLKSGCGSENVSNHPCIGHIERWESEVAQSCPTLGNCMDCSLPGSSILGILRQEYWSGLPLPSPGDLPDPGIEPGSPALWADALTSEPPLLILKVDSFGWWWSLSELTSFCFITYVSLYCGILYTKSSLEEVNFNPLSGIHFFLLYRSQQVIIIKKIKTNPKLPENFMLH